MLSVEPPRTAYDLHFQVAGIPVRVHPLFWLLALFFATGGGTGVDPDAGLRLLIFTGVLFVSILVHELGHSVVMRYFGQTPRIVLYMLGGLAIADAGSIMGYRAGGRTRPQQILISLAGPGAGFLLAVVTVAVVVALGGSFDLTLANVPFIYDLTLPGGISRALELAIAGLLWINIFWGLVNLLPVLPLDGGHVAQQLFEMADHANGLVRCLWLSVITGAVAAVAGWVYLDSVFTALLFGSLAISNYLTLQRLSGGGFGGRPW